MNEEEKVTITLAEYKDLLVDSLQLSMLHNGGVGNWDWYSDSLSPDGEPSFWKQRADILNGRMKMGILWHGLP